MPSRNIFEARKEFKPYEYPEVDKFKEAIQHSYWLVSEFNFDSDVQDFHVNLTEAEKSAIKNALLAISQIEVSVKRFWGKIGDKMPKAEIEQVGATFAESEIRHSEAYSKLLEVLGLNDEFTMLLQNPVIQGRVDYLTKYLKNARDNSNESYALTLALFSLFIENVSLFSQFLVIKSFSKTKNMLKAVDNVIQATIREECYVDGTEVLTPTGWKLIDSLKVGDEIYQYNHGKLEETKVLHTVSHEYDGPIYRFYNSKMDCRVTPNHDMIIFNPKGEMKKIKAKDFVPHSKQLFPVSAEKSGGSIDHLTTLDRIKIAVEADGNRTYWINKSGEIIQRGKNGGMNYNISLTRDRKKNRFEQLLSQSTIPYSSSRSTGEPSEIIYKIHLDMGVDYKSFDWVDLHDKSAQWCQEFVDELTFWDGYNYDGRIGYASSKKRSIDMVQAIGVLAGYKTNVPNAVGKRKNDGTQYRPCYKVSFSRNNLISSHGIHREKMDYKGNVSCVTVPSGVIVTRFNQKTTIAGNCLHALFGSYLVNIIKSENPSWFNAEFNEKLIRASKKAYTAECAIVDWMFEKGEIEGLPKDSVKEFIKHRLNESMKLIGFDKIFDIDSEKIAKVYWFIEELYADVNSDFFYKRPTNYSKKRRSVTASDLF